jgi:hypothetical protein
MQVTLSFKTPDVVDDALERAGDMSGEDRKKLKTMFKKFVEYDECIFVTFDTDTGKVTVDPV